MDRRRDIQDFLATTGPGSPQTGGVAAHGERRRAMGLRLEEVARLTGVSVYG